MGNETRERIESKEEALVDAAREGDLNAFDELAMRYRGASVGLARQYLPIDLAEDAAQDALISAFRSLKNLADSSRFKPWLGAIVRNRACRMARERKADEATPMYELDRMILEGAPSVAISMPDPADVDVVRAVAELPLAIRESIRLYYYESWSVGEIAAFTGRPVTTVKWQLHAGRELLRRKLGHLEEQSNHVNDATGSSS